MPTMLMFLILAVIGLGVITAASDAEWAVFKVKYSKVYNQEEDYFRRMIYEDNLKKIQSHNDLFAKGLKSFYLGENKYLDVTNAEFVKRMYVVKSKRVNAPSFKLQNVSLPPEVNWVKKGYVTPIKDNKDCGAEWAFSATGAMEGAHFKVTQKLVSLSEQNLIDCSRFFGNKGCEGGTAEGGFKYAIANKGIDTEESYPFKSYDGLCKFKPDGIGATMSFFYNVKSGSEDALKDAVASIGPVSVVVDAAHFNFQFYKGGVFNETDCSSTKVTNPLLTVGYGTEKGKKYWLVKNSWGTDWGEKGYIKMIRDYNNQCGIATMASYPQV